MVKQAEDKDRNRDEVITAVFKKHYRKGAAEVPFSMDDVREAIGTVARKNPSYKENNVADIRYQYTSGRRNLPKGIDELGPWMIEGRGKANYAFVRLKESPHLRISPDLHVILLPDATPEVVLEYAGSDEQGILAKLRYNRILDIFLGITCYHLQNHWRTSVKNKGQVEIDDLYVGLDVDGRQYVVPIEAKGRKDHISKTQIVQNIAFARERYPKLIIRPVGIQEIHDKEIVAIEFTPGKTPDTIKIKEMRRYKLVAMSECPVNEKW
jgi:hypothetical protein